MTASYLPHRSVYTPAQFIDCDQVPSADGNPAPSALAAPTAPPAPEAPILPGTLLDKHAKEFRTASYLPRSSVYTPANCIDCDQVPSANLNPAPSALEAPTAPEVPSAPVAPEAPAAPKTSKTAAAPKAPKAPAAPAAPILPGTLLGKKATANLLSISVGTLTNWTSREHRLYKPDFPKPRKLSTRSVRFSFEEVLTWARSKDLDITSASGGD